MKITGVETYVLESLLGDKAFGWSLWVTDRRQAALCVISTDEGIDGVGEALYSGCPAATATNLIDDAYAPLIIGRNPFDNAVVWDLLYNRTRDQGMKGMPICALSAIDIALWDIKGKALGLPIHKLLGGAYRDKAHVYATGLYQPQNVSSITDALTEEALGYKQDGFSAMKLKVGYGIEEDIRLVKAVREAIGDDISLMVDANHAYNASEAIRLAREMEKYNIHWFEEPVPPEDIDGYLEVKQKSGIIITGGECEYTRYGFRELITRRAVDILQPDLCAAGGFTELARIVTLASAWNVPVMPHVWGTNVGLAASLQFFATLPHFPERRYPAEPFFEYDRSTHPLRDGISREKFAMKNGYLDIPQRPGLGITLDMSFVKKYAIR
ncbi:MAG: mandelate racemase/muconate lactonizing enzyme family protein [Dehalococcoidales bacterium]|nr:mandelate racemase/muconate lactonizing enzyme family protein [Dehalococcoidales bacterium]